jgi:DNA polymerase-3 subunit alpha
MASIANINGFYYVPRIDKKIVEKYKEDIMVLSGNLYGEIQDFNIGENQAEEALVWWNNNLEPTLSRNHAYNQEDENRVNKT